MQSQPPTFNPSTPGHSNEEPKPPGPPLSWWERIKSFFNRGNVELFCEYAQTHSREMIAYALLSLGILLLFALPFLGQALVGIVAAVYFAPEIKDAFDNYDPYTHQLGIARSIVLIGTFLAFFILAPMIFVAGAITLIAKHFIQPDSTGTLPKQ
jgi:hypothetical protein